MRSRRWSGPGVRPWGQPQAQCPTCEHAPLTYPPGNAAGYASKLDSESESSPATQSGQRSVPGLDPKGEEHDLACLDFPQRQLQNVNPGR